ncbi:WhiB family transcriptional regulator [Mycobacterium sp. WMMD1722]|uniref:WhiB family transcriptional regulator n=1 Tax=Mycobacterium sp. WMMD1722 TaxID=3404117 RepID=UPI003BF59FE3
MSLETTLEELLPALPCHVGDPDLWFAESPVDLERAKALCVDCPIRRECLDAALARQEPWGVWGGEILDRGSVVARKRPRGRPRKDTRQGPAAA